jgi:hypothetical protein
MTLIELEAMGRIHYRRGIPPHGIPHVPTRTGYWCLLSEPVHRPIIDPNVQRNIERQAGCQGCGEGNAG